MRHIVTTAEIAASPRIQLLPIIAGWGGFKEVVAHIQQRWHRDRVQSTLAEALAEVPECWVMGRVSTEVQALDQHSFDVQTFITGRSIELHRNATNNWPSTINVHLFWCSMGADLFEAIYFKTLEAWFNSKPLNSTSFSLRLR